MEFLEVLAGAGGAAAIASVALRFLWLEFNHTRDQHSTKIEKLEDQVHGLIRDEATCAARLDAANRRLAELETRLIK